MINKRRVLVKIIYLSLGLAFCFAHDDVFAQSSVEKRIIKLNQAAMNNYDSLEFDTAKKQLHDALAIAKRAKLTNKKLLAEIFLNRGIVYGAGFNKRDEAIASFKKALEIDSKIKLSAARATPALDEMYKSAKASLGPIAPDPNAFKHNVVDEASVAAPIKLQALCKSGLNAYSVNLYYRTNGKDRFTKVIMGAYPGGVYRGQIPVSSLRGRSVYYYIEAVNDKGSRLAGSGEATRPNIIVLSGEVADSTLDHRVEDRDPEEPQDGYPTMSITLFGGSGVGLVFGGDSEHAHPQVDGSFREIDVTGGGALAPLHVGADISFFLSQKWQLGGMVRIQLLNALEGDQTEEKISVLGLLRARRFFGEGTLKPFIHFGVGGGQIRHRIPLDDYDKNAQTPNDIIDSRVAGFLAFSFGGGLHIAFNDYVGFVLEIGGLVLVPDFAAHADLNMGLAFTF